ncbi:MAG: ATP synthase subunit I [Methanothrix sp.]|jgi:F1/F0 ATPase, Methanosarcina type, subunit 2|nr:ATP synthase subunit I [Methanothrix sp.]MDI9399475.1 ATP synthase subunit I [Euryarchaeota archaeon]
MNEHLLPLFSFTFGIGLGVFFFGGLWLTINRLPQSKRPELLTLGSFLFRSAVSIFGFYLVVETGLLGLAFSLAGFILTKIVIVSRLGRHPERRAI